VKARVSNLIKTEAEWAKLSFKPYPGELIVYAPENSSSCAKIKVGDGVHLLNELPFVIDQTVLEFIKEYDQREIADAGRITDYFK
jgi:hypothetical protein